MLVNLLGLEIPSPTTSGTSSTVDDSYTVRCINDSSSSEEITLVRPFIEIIELGSVNLFNEAGGTRIRADQAAGQNFRDNFDLVLGDLVTFDLFPGITFTVDSAPGVTQFTVSNSPGVSFTDGDNTNASYPRARSTEIGKFTLEPNSSIFLSKLSSDQIFAGNANIRLTPVSVVI